MRRSLPAIAVTALIAFAVVAAHAQTRPPKPPGNSGQKATATPSVSGPPPPSVPPAPSPAELEAKRKDDARAGFERGKALMKEGAWDAALAELLRSRELYPTRGNTQNAAICLDKLQRFDEALEMHEKLLSEFPNVTAEDRTWAEGEITRLRGRVGTIEILLLEPGATVVVDGRIRGSTPLSTPLRVAAGAHLVRVFKEGFAPFETRVEVAGRQNTPVDGRLAALTRSGRLKVTEPKGTDAQVVIDNIAVGKAPWEGSLSVGTHAVLLRGAGGLGTPPATATIAANQTVSLSLAVEALESELRVQPSPVNAVVAVDGVSVGRGLWEGRVRAGDHHIEVGAEGFVSASRRIATGTGKREVVTVELERDRTSPLWRQENPPRVFFDLTAGAIFAPTLGGSLADGCTGACSRSLGVGGLALLHGGYQLGIGFGFSLDAGYLFVTESYSDRATELRPVGLTPNKGTSHDDLLLQGFVGGASGAMHVGSTWPLLVRLGGGVLLGGVRDSRSGKFTTNLQPTAYEVGGLEETSSATYAFVSPELRFGRRLGRHAELSLSVQALILFALSEPTWHNDAAVNAGKCPGAGCDGSAEFPTDALMGKTIVLVSPGLALRLDL